ncbi:MAG: hypothetical protein K940chlam1_00409 [Candidatus Anoxychlamydiales bacterium]|nr:hypothetical protein [Candidatus Anoxychlamydiales bacterium]
MARDAQELLKTYLKLFEIKIKSFEKIEHEEALSSTIYKLIMSDSSIRILKISFNKKRWVRECYCLEAVKKHILVPKIIEAVESKEDASGAILMEYIPGKLIVAQSLTNDLSFQMGSLLASLHQIDVKFYGDFSQDQILPPSIESGFSLLKEYFEKSFKECENHLQKELLDIIKKYFYESLKEIKNLDGPHIIHRDFKPGNIIVKNNKIKALIDWEIAKNSFAEEDFSQMEYLVWDKYPKTKDAFLEGYKAVRSLPDLEQVMPIIRISKALGAIGFTIERNTYRGRHKFVFDQCYRYLQNIFLK